MMMVPYSKGTQNMISNDKLHYDPQETLHFDTNRSIMTMKDQK